MLPVSLLALPDLVIQPILGFLADGIFHPPTSTPETTSPYVTLILRWLHILFGIVWIGHLYFFNLVNVNLMKVLDGPTKGKVIPQLMPRALWWFRWGAVLTVLIGLMYYAMYVLPTDVRNVKYANPNSNANTWVILLVWLLITVVIFAIGMFAMKSVNNGWVLAIIIGLLALVLAAASVKWIESQLGDKGGTSSYSIGIGGGLGIWMLFNVWGIIWPNQKRIIGWTANNAEKGTPIPAESAKLARVAFLASRTNTWLSIPMLFFMVAANHFPGWIG
jgi:uncharacterized membrane protein